MVFDLVIPEIQAKINKVRFGKDQLTKSCRQQISNNLLNVYYFSIQRTLDKFCCFIIIFKIVIIFIDIIKKMTIFHKENHAKKKLKLLITFL